MPWGPGDLEQFSFLSLGTTASEALPLLSVGGTAMCSVRCTTYQHQYGHPPLISTTKDVSRYCRALFRGRTALALKVAGLQGGSEPREEWEELFTDQAGELARAKILKIPEEASSDLPGPSEQPLSAKPTNC